MRRAPFSENGLDRLFRLIDGKIPLIGTIASLLATMSINDRSSYGSICSHGPLFLENFFAWLMIDAFFHPCPVWPCGIED